jgi:flagellar export protein FliJ
MTMKSTTLNMILKLKEWEEEIEKQKFASIITEKAKMEAYIEEIEKRFDFIKYERNNNFTSDELITVFSEIQHLTGLLNKARDILQKINEELEKQREIYEESYKEREKIQQLYDKLISMIRREREKIEEKIISDVYTSRFRGA